ncbi:CBS and ACT domain-containing protein [Enterococcus casseliflavus]|uniref:CBS and ACT domain-containing protein n=1 Tax=Enterococcus casseliflavus TaxID=37734 RepID=UPI003DA3E559
MSVSDFMTKTVVTVDSQTPIFDAVDLMKQHDIHRLPVVDDGKLVGLITEGTIAEATPSKATSLSVYEMNYLLNKTTVADIMLKKVTTIEPDALLEDAISVMRSENVGVLPVMDDDALVGIITNNDIFDAFLKITGYHDGGTRASIEITDDHVGVLADVTKLLADHQMSILTIVVNRMALKTIVEIQVESRQVAAIEKILSDAGYTVTSAVLTNQK